MDRLARMALKVAGLWPEASSLMDAAKDPGTDRMVLDIMSGHDDPEVRAAVAANCSIKEETLMKLFMDPDERVWRAAMGNGTFLEKLGDRPMEPDASPVMLERCALVPSYQVKWEVASNKSCPGKALERLSVDDDWSVRYSVALNPNCPAAALVNLAGDSSMEIPWAVARHLNCPADVLVKLASSKSWWVRNFVVKNPNCPAEALRILAEDPDRKNRELARKHPNYKP